MKSISCLGRQNVKSNERLMKIKHKNLLLEDADKFNRTFISKQFLEADVGWLRDDFFRM